MDIVECSVESAVFSMIVSNEWERYRVETLATKEPETVSWIIENFRPGDVLFDVGANIGIYAILAAAHNREGTVVAVEPMAATFARLCHNTLLNGFDNLRPWCVAIAAADGAGAFDFSSLTAASSMHSPAGSNMTEQFGEKVAIQAGIGLVSLDSLAGMVGMPNLIKIDVDGGEDAVLAGAERVLANPTLRSVLIEFNWVAGSPSIETRDMPLRRAGFEPWLSGIEYARGSVRWQNTIYSRSPLGRTS
jgi:FkbM family methyltransferase